MSGCAFESQLSGYLDSDLELREMAAVREHVGSCASCTRTLGELRKLVAGLRDLPAGEPAPAAWREIAVALDRTPRGTLWIRRVSLGVGFCAAAAAASWAFVTRPPAPMSTFEGGPSDQVLLEQARRQFEAAEAHYAQAVHDLRAIADRERGKWRPELAKSYDDNLRAIDEAIARTREAARKRAGDPSAMEHVLAGYRKEVAFLQESIQNGSAAAQELDPL